MSNSVKYISGHGQEVRELLDALGIAHKGVAGVRLIVEPETLVRVEVERLVTDEELNELTQWVLKYGIEAQQLDPESQS